MTVLVRFCASGWTATTQTLNVFVKTAVCWRKGSTNAQQVSMTKWLPPTLKIDNKIRNVHLQQTQEVQSERERWFCLRIR